MILTQAANSLDGIIKLGDSILYVFRLGRNMICSNTPGFPRAWEWQSRYHKIWTRTGFEEVPMDSRVRNNEKKGCKTWYGICWVDILAK